MGRKYISIFLIVSNLHVRGMRNLIMNLCFVFSRFGTYKFKSTLSRGVRLPLERVRVCLLPPMVLGAPNIF